MKLKGEGTILALIGVRLEDFNLKKKGMCILFICMMLLKTCIRDNQVNF